MSEQMLDDNFPCLIIIDTPFPDARLALTAQQALQVDEELSPLVRRSFSVVSSSSANAAASHGTGTNGTANGTANGIGVGADADAGMGVGAGIEMETETETETVLRTHYRATTNRMLRVSVNGFFESLAVVLQVMEELDVDVLAAKAEGG